MRWPPGERGCGRRAEAALDARCALVDCLDPVAFALRAGSTRRASYKHRWPTPVDAPCFRGSAAAHSTQHKIPYFFTKRLKVMFVMFSALID
jgi:hypothetical protein